MPFSTRDLPRAALAALTFLGALSRFTHGRYTPAFYRYQIERAPDDASTRYIPFVDVAVGLLLSFSRTQSVGAFLCVTFQGLGIVLQLRKRGKVLPDVGMFLMAAVAFGLGVGLF
ncbi:hypothetical protein QBC34DRAFT_156157 [Podospora aff. communis PSN243]|uniref:Uncharacterized protein n=1 Tax=Podospora aff. communis PSN243 TaxID=3040156 RepID=A0AAV9H0Y9_9PEZI|nr:hypothetical protein QBC34DRAFT_156157 [Podospora aff. communis PSN243]